MIESQAMRPTAPPEFAPVRPDGLVISPLEDGRYGIDVRWRGRECILRAVVVRRLLTEAGYDVQPGNSHDGRLWKLRVEPVPSDEVANVIATYIW
jgi:hypothetical protein